MTWWTVTLWGGLLLVAVFGADWGADQLSGPVRTLRHRWGLSAIQGGALVGLTLAGPEIAINAASAYRGAADVGLGLILGGNVLSLPLLTSIAYLASREPDLGERAEVESSTEHESHVEDRFLRIQSDALSVLTLPYIGLIVLVGLLTLPAGWRGLQPIDGVVLIVAYLVYLLQAIVRGRGDRDLSDAEWSGHDFVRSLGGVAVLVAAAYGIVTATEQLAAAFGISALLGGLFITAPLGLAPEAFGTWHVTRSGQITEGAVDVITDSAVTLTLAMVPLSLVVVPIENFRLFWVSLLFVLLMPLAYAAFVRWGTREAGFARWEVVAFDFLFVLYVGIVLVWVLDVV